jgi:RNA polymerase sigma-70 factor, ECF subfamily
MTLVAAAQRGTTDGASRIAKPFKDELVTMIPNLRAFAVSLCGNSHTANDLVQETLLKAWAHQNSFAESSNLRAWLFTILRNTYLSTYRKTRREVPDVDGEIAAQVPQPAEQESHVELADFRRALTQLNDEQREALLLVGAEGFSYEEAASIANCAIGTIKSRVSRARQRLGTLMAVDVPDIAPREGGT